MHLGLQHGVLRLVVLQGVQQERCRLPHSIALQHSSGRGSVGIHFYLWQQLPQVRLAGSRS